MGSAKVAFGECRAVVYECLPLELVDVMLAYGLSEGGARKLEEPVSETS